MSAPEIPGLDLVERGLADLREGRETAAALLVEIAAPRLRFVGFEVPVLPPREPDTELRLYALLCSQPDVADPYRRYNDLLRQLSSTCRALESRRFGQLRQTGRPR